MRIVISGYYGFNNSGDDALLMAIIDDIKSVCKDAHITVLSGNAKETREKYGVGAIYRYNIFSVLYNLLKCDLLVSGGGTLIQDATSTKSLLYYLGIIRIAKFFRRKVMLYANGIGPLTSFKNVELTKDVLSGVDLITLRDENSSKEIEQIGISGPEIHVTADPVFLLEPNDRGEEILENYGIPTDKKLLCVSVRKFKGSPKDFEDVMAEFCDYAADKYNLFPVFLPMQKRNDYAISAAIKNKMKNRSVIIGTNCDISSLLSIVRRMHICVGMRLHTLIYSAICGVPMIGIVYDPKVNGCLEYMGEERFVNVDGISKAALSEYLDAIYNDYESVQSNLKFNVRLLRGKARENRELMQKLLGERES